jgi:uncharacterized membrane protein YgcG
MALTEEVPAFPVLTGRVVDQAGLLSPQLESQLDSLLVQHELATSDQVVVVTLKSLQGIEIADYGYQLGRYWGIGQQEKDNGVMLIVAPNEHKVRIEVGYGLEGTLSDAICNDIIQSVILPAFRQGEYGDGIRSGTIAMLQALGGSYEFGKPEAYSRWGNEDDAIPSALHISGDILYSVILPALHRGDYGGGLRSGAEAISQALEGSYEIKEPGREVDTDVIGAILLIGFVLIALIGSTIVGRFIFGAIIGVIVGAFVFAFTSSIFLGVAAGIGVTLLNMTDKGGRRRRRKRRAGSSGLSSSGGGGSFGGGGASGGW